MKLTTLLTISVLLTHLCASAATTVTDSRSRLETTKIARGEALRKARAAHDAPTLYTSMIVRFDNADDLSRITDELGGVIFHTRADMALCCIPRDKVEEMAHGHYVDSYAIGRKATANCDRLREGLRIVSVDQGNETPLLPVNGKGVVAGICDIGLDPSHIAFKDRLGMVSTYIDSLAIREVWAPGSALDTGASLNADTDDIWHGTHVLNILGGSNTGTPYHGVATGATLAASRSYLTDVALLSGIEDILAYARERKMPCVINLSVGSYLGPHDGSDLVNRYLSLLGREGIIVFSAGNNGNSNVTLRHTLGPDSPGQYDGLPSIGTMWENAGTWNGFDIRGAMDIWSADTQSCDVRIVVYDQIESKFVYRTPWYGPTATGNAEGEAVLDAADIPELADILKGSRVDIAWGTSPENNRYNIALDYAMISEATIPGHHWARYVMGWEVRGHHGFSFDAYTDGIQTFMRNYGTPFKVDGTSELTISNLCCSDAVIGVGAWNTRNATPLWETEKEHTFTFDLNTPAVFSSYGTLRDGRVMPDICAPGNTVVSAISGAYLANHRYDDIAHKQTVDGIEYAWAQECGTSMASPAVAGVIALWAQAHPTIDVFTARKVAAETAFVPGDSGNPRWGAAGAIDADAGLSKLDEMAGCSSIKTDDTDDSPAQYFDLTGRRIVNPGPGIYILRRGTHAKKVVLR